jgi:hypothetical protein
LAHCALLEWFFGVLFDCDWKRSFLRAVGRWKREPIGEWEFIRPTVDEFTPIVDGGLTATAGEG